MLRRDLLAGTAVGLALWSLPAAARTIAGALPWVPDAGNPPVPVTLGPWKFFTADEAKAVEALVDRIIPPDPPGTNPQTPGGKDAGCAVYIDAQLAGPFGNARGLYMRPPFQDGTPQQGNQSPLTPAQRYRQTLAALDKYCRSAFAGKTFAELSDDQKDQIIGQMEKGPLKLEGASATAFFEMLVKNAGRLSRRSDLRRQSRHGRLEDVWFGCGNYSKASPQTTLLPIPVRRPNFAARTLCEVTRINLDGSGKRATGVTYVDSSGAEWEQPADLVLLCAFQLFNVHLLLLSGIGTPYDPNTGEGVICRNYSYQVTSSVNGFWDNKNFNPFIASGAIGYCIDDFNGDNFDHGPLGFVGGGYIGTVQTNGRPILGAILPKGTPSWGAGWKKAMAENYLTAYQSVTHGSCYSYRDAYLDLDPTYTDPLGRKLLRINFDFHPNELKMSQYLTDRLAEIVEKMGPRQLDKKPRTGPYTITDYQTTHTCGGAVMGADPKTSVVNRYLQSWDVSNLFVTGATVFPQNAGYNPTGTVCALAYWAADALVNQYLKHPGPLVQ